MFVLSDRIKETTLTVGSGNIVLNGQYGAFQSFNSGVGDGNQTYYAIENYNQWEVGIGTYTVSNNSLSRDLIFDSSNGGNKINLLGTSIVFCTLPAQQAIVKDNSDKVFLNSSVVDSNGRIGVLTASPAYELDVAGSGKMSTLTVSSGVYYSDGSFQTSANHSHKLNYNNVTSDFSVSNNSDIIFADTTSGPINIYLPSASGQGGKQLIVKFKSGSNNITLIPSGSQTIDGEAQFDINFRYQSFTLVSDNLNWFLI